MIRVATPLYDRVPNPPTHRYQCPRCFKVFRGKPGITYLPHRSLITLEPCGVPLDDLGPVVRDRKPHPSDKAKSQTRYLGIDGEGIGRFPHRYVYLAVSDATGKEQASIESVDGLSTVECLDFILSIPPRFKIVGFSFGYDLCKILTDLDDHSLYLLYHPGKRRTVTGRTTSVHWGDYTLNLIAGRFSVTRKNRTRVIWDVFKFFQSSFVKALRTWRIGDAETLDRMSAMKSRRSTLESVYASDSTAVWSYCLSECRALAELGETLVKAHEDAGIALKSLYGAGSTASAILTSYGVREKRGTQPKEVLLWSAHAFFGGRFETSIVGPVEGYVYGADLSGAYPAEIAQLPCLECGTWRKTNTIRDLRHATTAVVRYSLRKSDRTYAWGPFPFRLPEGDIVFPTQSGGGVVWLSEFRAGKRAFPELVRFEEAWVYHTDCECHPFRFVPDLYRKRLEWGKDGKGIVMKLGLNAIAGKCMQSKGKAPFRSPVWGGMITAGTRAKLLDVLALHSDPWNLLMTATDGIYTRERIVYPKAPPLGLENTKKPLGGWELKDMPTGAFIARPGVYFPLHPTDDDLDAVRARGLGKSVVFGNWSLIIESFARYGHQRPVILPNVSRFCGVLSTVQRKGPPKGGRCERATGRRSETRILPDGQTMTHDLPSYGEWVERPMRLDFGAMPKRAFIDRQNRLHLRQVDRNLLSAPYNSFLKSDDIVAYELEKLIDSEQPEGELAPW